MAGEQQVGNILYNVEMDVAQLVKGQQTANDRLSRLESGFNSAGKSADSFGATLSKVAGAITAALSIKQITEYANAWVEVSNKLSNSIRPSEQLADVTERVFKIAQDSRASLDATATLYARLERATRTLGTSTGDLAQLTETINKAFIVSGASADEANGAIVQLSQGLASGVLRGDEFNTIMESGSRLAGAIADSLGVTTGQLRAMAAQGALTTDVVVNGLLGQSDKIAKEFGNTVLTMSQAFTVATNNITKFVGESSSTNTVLSIFNNSVITLSENLDVVANVIGIVAAVVGSRYVAALAMASLEQVKLAATAVTASAAQGTLATSTAVLRGALALLGGPIGAATLAAAAIFYFYQKSQQAKQESIDFSDKLDGVISRMKEMSQIQLAANIDKSVQSIKDQRGALEDINSTIAANEEQQAKLQRTLSYLRTGSVAYNYTLSELNAAQSEHTQLVAAAETANDRYLSTINKTSQLQAQFNGGVAEGTGVLKEENLQIGVADGLMRNFADALNIAGKAKDNFNSKSLILPENAKVQQYVDGLREESDLLAISDKRLRSVTEARNKAFAGGGNANQVNAAGELAGTIYDQQKAEQDLAKTTKAGAKEADVGAQKIADLQRQLEFLNLTYGESDREAAVLNATQAANGKVTDEQKVKIGQLAGALFDAKQKQSDLNAAIEADPTRKENKSFDEATKTLQRQLAEGIVSQTQFNEQSEKLAMNHQIALAQIQANQAVTPQAQAAGTVDPVQQLANENAQKLALIQAYEAQGVITHQNALMQMNALDTEYETARNAALWKQWADQSAVNTLMAGAIDALGSQASSAITGFLNGTQSANEALQNVANTILNSVVQGFVEMGLAQVRAAVTGAAAQQAATVATTATSVAGIATTTAASTTAAGTTLAAWLPAALVASVGSFGAAAIIGGAALVGAFALSKTLGKRKNGGPVTAGGMYQVGEGGAPELYQGANGRQYMIPGDNGSVISNKDLGTSGTGSTGSNVSVNVHNYGSSQVQTNQSTAADGTLTIDMVLSDFQEGGPLSQGIANNFTTKRRATE